MMPWQPLDEKIEAAPPRLETDAVAPVWPALHQRRKAQQSDDVRIRAVLQQPNRGPIAVQAPNL